MATNNPDELQQRFKGKITTARLKPTRPDGQPNTVVVRISRKKELYIFIPYIKGGVETSFLQAAQYKKQRLKEQNPEAVYWIEPVTTADEFKLVWKQICSKTTDENAKYRLIEIHFLGHSGHDALYFLSSTFTMDMVKQLERLAFDKKRGALILHSCLSARWEENKSDNKGNSKKNESIAKKLSKHLQTKVIGQMVKATFNTGNSLEALKYRNSSLTNTIFIDVVGSKVVALWGYKAGSSVEKYNGTEDYKMLNNYQIWPARGYDKGMVLPRVVHPDYFNEMDLTYI